jgi:cysteine desulfurase/selenocysteine lyase
MPLHDKLNWPATARASFYLYTTEADIDVLVAALERAAEVFKIA